MLRPVLPAFFSGGVNTSLEWTNKVANVVTTLLQLPAPCPRTPKGSNERGKTQAIPKDKRMTTQIYTLIHKSSRRLLNVALVSSLIAATALIAADGTAAKDSQHEGHGNANAAPAKLVQLVRDATRQFINVNSATAAGYGPFLGCISGPDHGAMGVHYVNGPLVGDGLLDASKPEALIYEPSEGGLKLIGVEFIVDAATWLAHHSGTPVLEGQTFNLVTSPNRFGLPAFFELHVWAWRDNPNGAFVDWNNKVSCEGQ